MMWIAETDVRLLEDFSTATFASDLGVDLRGGTLADRVARIRSADSKAADLLQDFHGAYREWFDFHKKLDAEGLAADPVELADKMDRRDSARQALLAYREVING